MLYQTEQARNRINYSNMIATFGVEITLRYGYIPSDRAVQKFIITPDYTYAGNSQIAQSAVLVENQQRIRLTGSWDAAIAIDDVFYLNGSRFRVESVQPEQNTFKLAFAVRIVDF